MKYVRDKAHCKHETFTKEDIVNTIYPIGSIYIGINETNPSELFGGTWEQIKDTFLLSAGDTYTAGSTGGEAKHTLTIAEMPSHTHNVYNDNPGGYDLQVYTATADSKKGFAAIGTTSAGGGEAHNNMPPYLTVYMWKRMA